jgi:hypothetical protein
MKPGFKTGRKSLTVTAHGVAALAALHRLITMRTQSLLLTVDSPDVNASTERIVTNLASRRTVKNTNYDNHSNNCKEPGISAYEIQGKAHHDDPTDTAPHCLFRFLTHI